MFKYIENECTDDFLRIKNIFSVNSIKLILLQAENTLLFSELYTYLLTQKISIILISSEVKSSEIKNLIINFKPDLCILKSFQEIKNQIDDYICLYEKQYCVYERKEFILDEILIPCLLLSTSGSTGSKKFVRISYENLEANTKSIINYLSIKSTDITITNLPLHYSFGLSVLNTHLYSGAKVIFTNHSVIQKEFWDLVKEHRVTNLFGVPYTFEILDKIRFFRMDLPNIRLIAQAGGKLNILLQDKYVDFCSQKGIEYYTMYGQTEATARMSYVPPIMSLVKKGSIGIPIPDGRFELRDASNQIVNDAETVGELVYCGPNVSLGYASTRRDLYNPDENSGVLYTGDLAKFDNEGYYYIVGRKNRFLKLYGNRISLEDLEDKLFNLGIEAVCGGVDDNLTTYITDFSKIEFVKKWLSKITLIHSSAFEVKFIQKIPRNISGKILYTELF